MNSDLRGYKPREEMVINNKENSRKRSESVRRNSIVLTPDVLHEYAKEELEAAMCKRQYEQACRCVFGTLITYVPETILPTDRTVHTRYRRDPCLIAMGFFS